MTIDELRDLLATPSKSDDDAVLDFYCWQDAEHWSEMIADETHRHVANTLADWFRRGLPPATISDVIEWLKDWFDPDAIDGDEADMHKLIERYKNTR